MLAGGQRIKWRRNIAENFNRLSRVHERYRQTTDGRTTTYSEHELEFTFSKITALFYFCNNFVKPGVFWQFLAGIYLSKFPITNIFYILNEENQLKFQQCAHNLQASSSRDARLRHSTKPVGCGFLAYPTSVLLITESWKCYRSRSVNILCDMLISWGNVWLADTIIDQAIDRWWFRLRAWVMAMQTWTFGAYTEVMRFKKWSVFWPTLYINKIWRRTATTSQRWRWCS